MCICFDSVCSISYFTPFSYYVIHFVCYRHNLHHYMEFFKSIREAIKSNSLESLKRCVNERNDVS